MPSKFEKAKQPNEIYSESPNNNNLFNCDSGRVIDKPGGATGTVNATFQSVLSDDIVHINGRNGNHFAPADRRQAIAYSQNSS